MTMCSSVSVKWKWAVSTASAAFSASTITVRDRNISGNGPVFILLTFCSWLTLKQSYFVEKTFFVTLQFHSTFLGKVTPFSDQKKTLFHRLNGVTFLPTQKVLPSKNAFCFHVVDTCVHLYCQYFKAFRDVLKHPWGSQLRLIHITAFSTCICSRRLHCSAEIEKLLSLHWHSPLRNPQTAAASVNEPLGII